MKQYSRVTNRELQAQLLYDQAINAAHASGFVHDEALANELAARYWMQRKVAKFARLLLTDACTLLDHCAGLYPCSVVCRLRVLAVGSATQDARTSNGGAKPDTAKCSRVFVLSFRSTCRFARVRNLEALAFQAPRRL